MSPQCLPCLLSSPSSWSTSRWLSSLHHQDDAERRGGGQINTCPEGCGQLNIHATCEPHSMSIRVRTQRDGSTLNTTTVCMRHPEYYRGPEVWWSVVYIQTFPSASAVLFVYCWFCDWKCDCREVKWRLICSRWRGGGGGGGGGRQSPERKVRLHWGGKRGGGGDHPLLH